MLKNAGSATIWSGAKLFEAADESKPEYVSDDADGSVVTWADWGLVDPNSEVVVPKEGDEDTTTDDGATALYGTVATLLAAFLVF